MDAERGSLRPPSLGERGIAFLLVFVATGALMPLLRLGGGSTPDDAAAQIQVAGDPVQQRVWLLAYLVVAGLVIRHHRVVLSLARRTTVLWLIVGLAVLSTTWSAAPSLTLRRGVLLVGMTAFGAYLAARFPGGALVGLLSAVLAAIAVLSLAFALALPAYGLEHGLHAGSWRGVFAHKNELGRVMAFGATLWLLRALYGYGRFAVNLAFLGLSMALLILAGSTTSLLVLVAIGAALTGLRALQAGVGVVGMVLAVAGIVVPVGAIWLLGNYEALLAALGRDATLTGRTAYWEQARLAIEQRPLLGYGYGGFWQGGLEGPAADFILAVGQNPSHAHNGILDLWLMLGLVGVGLFVASAALNLLRALLLLARGRGIEGVFPLAFLLFLAASNVTESDLITYNSVFWLLYAAVTVQLASAFAPVVSRTGVTFGALPVADPESKPRRSVAPVPASGRAPA